MPQPNVASKLLTKFYSDVFVPMGILMETKKTAAARLLMLTLCDGDDGNDGESRSEILASLRKENDGPVSPPEVSSQPSFASSGKWEKLSDDEDLPF